MFLIYGKTVSCGYVTWTAKLTCYQKSEVSSFLTHNTQKLAQTVLTARSESRYNYKWFNVRALTAFPESSLVNWQCGKKRFQVYFGLVQQLQDVHLLLALWWLNRCEVRGRAVARGCATRLVHFRGAKQWDLRHSSQKEKKKKNSMKITQACNRLANTENALDKQSAI